MEINEFLVILAGVGLVMWASFGLMMYYQKRKQNEPLDKFNRAFMRNKQIMAVHSPDGKMTFKAYNPTHAEAENYISEKEHYRNLLVTHTQTIGDMDVTHRWEYPSSQFNEDIMYASGGGGAGGNGSILIPSDTLHPGIEPTVEVEVTKPEKEQVIVQHRPGDRFMDIVGE